MQGGSHICTNETTQHRVRVPVLNACRCPMTATQNGIMSLTIRIRSFSQGLLLRSLSFGPSLLPAPSTWSPTFGFKVALYTLYHVTRVGKLFLSISCAYEEHNHPHFRPSERLEFSAPLSGSRRRSRRRSGMWYAACLWAVSGTTLSGPIHEEDNFLGV